MASECVEGARMAGSAGAPAWARLVVQVGVNVLGLFVFALGSALTLRSGLGLGPWDVLHQGLSKHTPLSFGQASQLVGAVVIGAGLLLRIRPGLGAVLNMALIGYFVDRILGSGLLPSVAPFGWPAQFAVDALGVLVVGFGSGLYIRANLGAGPRDGLMLGLHRVTGQRIAVTRAGLELSVAVTGFVLGGTVGPGTLVFALGIGPAVEIGFHVFRVPSRRAETVEPA